VRDQHQRAKECADGKDDKHGDRIEIARQQTTQHRPDRAAAVYKTRRRGTGFGRAKVNRCGATDHRIRSVQGQPHHKQEGNHQQHAAGLQSPHKESQRNGQRQQTQNAGGHTPGTEDFV